ncbi:hypothetical protein [Peribacillus glennii]|uniref:Uncharacterized protein n=1 Tax=Peribacillus glennii TaxID=2303991 RepID=A0A372LGD4_9BACI|nr:hypothetical protein [Peribacillus glennii]RFU64666.1 hypothetical protein D0466_01690 [Peribacillus glennii]
MTMNERLLEILFREVVASLAPEKRKVYEFIVNLEDELASKSQTPEEFLGLLKNHSPHQKAANEFNLTFGKTLMLMHEIEDEITTKLELRSSKIKWIDCTEHIKINQEYNKIYLLLS